MRRTHSFTGRQLVGAAVAALVLIGPAALGQSIPVTAVVAAGSRALDLSTPTGAGLTSVSIGNTGTAPFVARVTDVQYSRSGYQVTATMSNLYSFAGGQYDCQKRIDASNLSLGFLVSPIGVSGVKALAQPVFDLAGTVQGALATQLGLVVPLNLSVSNVAGEDLEGTLAGALSGVEDTLPIKVATGTAGSFTNPAAHSSCDPNPAQAATTRALMAGTQSNQAALLSWVQNAISGVADQNHDGTISGTELAGSSVVDQAQLAAAVRAALIAGGVNGALLDSLISAGTVSYAQLFALLTSTLDGLTGLLGQSGTYIALPKLDAAIPSNTTAGTYRGTLTVTLVDVP